MIKQHDSEFKMNAIKYRQEHPELTVNQVCNNLEIATTTYYKWLKQLNHRA